MKTNTGGRFSCLEISGRQNRPLVFDRKEEFAAVGLAYNSLNDITENDIRKEHGLSKRGAY